MTILVTAAAIAIALIVIPCIVGAFLRRRAQDYPEVFVECETHQPRHVQGRHR
jgi:hypothetical protein